MVNSPLIRPYLGGGSFGGGTLGSRDTLTHPWDEQTIFTDPRISLIFMGSISR